MTEHRELLDLIPSYALGALEEDERRRLEAHLDGGCPECEEELRGASRQLEALAGTVEPVVPSEVTRARLERAVSRRRRSAARPALRRAAVAAVGLLLLWSVWLQLGLRRELERQASARERADARLAEMRDELERTRSTLTRLSYANRIIASPETRSVLLAGLDPSPDASGQTFVDPVRGEAVFYASNLPPVAEDRTYQLWLIADGTPLSAGVFDVEPDGSAMLLVEDIERPDAIQLWAVTIEPAGGVQQPTGAMVLKG